MNVKEPQQATPEAASAPKPIRPKGRFLEIVTTVSVSVLLFALALTLEPLRTGDGQYYFAMLVGLANNGSPAITDEVREVVIDRLNIDTGKGMTIAARDERLYAWHFFAYPLLCVPAYKLLHALDRDVLAAFQLTNAALIAFALIYVLVLSRLSAPARWFIATGFLLSTATIYFQWTHPEVFTAALVLMASVGLVTRQYGFAALLAALGSLQNPSAALLIVPIVCAQIWELRVRDGLGWLSRGIVQPLGITLAASMVAFVSYGWNFYKFGVPNPIAAKGVIDYSNINLGRLDSFVFDLNQGLIVGLPLFLWAVPVALFFRAMSTLTDASAVLRKEDLLLVGFLLMALPTLGQLNWNAGHSIFLRYASWAGMAPLVWVAVVVGIPRSGWMAAGLVPAAALQAAMALYIGGVALPRFPSYVQFMPWVEHVWNFSPRLYNPLPDIFFERLVGDEVSIETPAVLKGSDGEMIRVLDRIGRIEKVAEHVCGVGGAFAASDGRDSSEPHIRMAERGFWYVTGRLYCGYTAPVSLSPSTGAEKRPTLLQGWYAPEEWGFGAVARMQHCAWISDRSRTARPVSFFLGVHS